MPKPSLKLPNMPAAAIMELRTEDGLELMLDEAADSYVHARVAELLSQKALDMMATSFWSPGERQAFDVGVRVAQVVSYMFASRIDESPCEVLTCESTLGILDSKTPNPQNFNAYTERVLKRLDVESPRALSIFESIGRVHVDDKGSVEFARRGAAALHNLVYQIDTFTQDDQFNRPFKRVGHLSLVH